MILFYEQSPDNTFRFGDVLTGFVNCTPKLRSPFLSENDDRYTIQVGMPPYFVVMSPCCSIADKVIALCPLIHVRNTFFKNPYFAENLARLNRKIPPEKAVPPEAWKNMPSDQKQDRLNQGPAYAFVELFIYAEHRLLREYEVSRKKGPNIQTRFYMIDFRDTFKVCCDRVNSPKDSPVDAKLLQLTVDVRSQLRDKVSAYFARIPDEDLVLIG